MDPPRAQAPTPDARLDVGNTLRGELPLLLEKELSKLRPGQVLQVVAPDAAAPEDPDRATVAFTLANAAVGSEQETGVFLSSDGVHLAMKGVADSVAEGGFAPLTELMASFAEAGGKISTCLPCFNERGLDADRLVQGAVIVGGPKLVAFMAPGAPSVSY